MSYFALNKDNHLVISTNLSDADWDELKQKSKLGDFKMLCCGADAILKTSINYNKFFAHYNSECSTAPESVWHKTAKALISNSLVELGIEPIEEMNRNNKWQADIYFKVLNREIVIELQHSQQTLNKYLLRQQRYLDYNVESYWLIYEPCFFTLMKAIGKFIQKSNTNKPLRSFYPFLEILPILMLKPDHEPQIIGANLFKCSIKEWLSSIIDRKFVFSEGHWTITQ